MHDTESNASPTADAPARRRGPTPKSTLDAILAMQIVVAWAGERGDDPRRMGWWRSDLVSEFGGGDLMAQLLPHTQPWAMLQSVREVARRVDATRRGEADNPDAVRSIFALGFDLDERLDETLQAHKRAGTPPLQALPGLRDAMPDDWQTATTWDRDAFELWLSAQHDLLSADGKNSSANATPEHKPAPIGRLIPGTPPADPERTIRRLVAALLPLADDYPLPHFRTKS